MSRSVVTIARSLVAGSAMAVCGACNAGSDLDKELATVRSWTATAHLAVEERRAGATTARYTSQLRDRAAEALDAERRQLANAEHSSDDHTRARPVLDSLAQALRTLAEATGP
jgi:hypothetical protein